MQNIGKTTLLIMAAGLGSRYGGNKQVDRIGPDGEILMQYSVFDAVKAGFNKIVFIIKPEYRTLLEKIYAPLVRKGIEIVFVYQDFSSIPSFYKIPDGRVKPFGTVHAVLCAKQAIKEPFAIINADDFYGADSFRVIYDALTELKYPNALMVAYDLKNTVSKNGTVTRGICEVEVDTLKAIREVYDIGINENGDIFDKSLGLLDASCPVSMNMWGFTPEIFNLLDASFSEFLSNIQNGDLKAEYVLPSFVAGAIRSNALVIKVLRTSAEWFGVTYKEDRDAVAKKLLDFKKNGIYPEKLI